LLPSPHGFLCIYSQSNITQVSDMNLPEKVCFIPNENCLVLFWHTVESKMPTQIVTVKIEEMFQRFYTSRFEDFVHPFQKSLPIPYRFPLHVSMVELDAIGRKTENLTKSSSVIFLSDSNSLEIWKISSGTYLLSFTSWDHVKYLEVSDVEGFLYIYDGLLAIPTIKSDWKENLDVTNDDERILRHVAQHCLWTDGIEIRCGSSKVSTEVYYNDLHEVISSISLHASPCWEEPHPSCSNSWRACIENVLQHTVVDEIKKYQDLELQTKRRRYLLQRSLEVLDEMRLDMS
jgi:hypothetical protein